MSDNNGIYILMTKRGRGKKEYRVAHCQAIENIFDSPDYPRIHPVLNEGAMLRKFGLARRSFTDRKVAEGYAMRWIDSIVEQGGVVESDIQWLDYPWVRFPTPYEDAESDQYLQQLEWEMDWTNRNISRGSPIPSSKKYTV